MAPLLRNIARKIFVDFLEVLNTRRLVSFRQTFTKGDNVLRVLSHLWTFIDPHKRESHSKQRRNFPYTLFSVLGIVRLPLIILKKTLCPHYPSVRASLVTER